MNVALIGSGSWGTAVAGLAAARAERVTMWAHSEQTAAGINGEHRNPRYLVDEVEKNGVTFRLKKLWIFCIRFLTPILVAAVTLTGFASIYSIVRG